MLACLFDNHFQRVITHTRYAGSGTSLAVWSVVVMTNGDNHPVAFSNGLFDGLPQLIIKGTTAHAPQRLVLNGDLCWIEIRVGIITPAPLAVIAITQRTCTHRGVANQKQYGMTAHPTRSRQRSCRQSLGNAVGRIIHNTIHILRSLCHLCL